MARPKDNASNLSVQQQAVNKVLQGMGYSESVRKESRYTDRTVDRLTLRQFVEQSFGGRIILEPWQIHLCKRLEKLTFQKGQRILVHKPPQHGGSIIVSQRLPAYLVGDDPNTRVRLTCYNIDHATTFTAINKAIMQSQEYATMFSDSMTDLELHGYRPKDAEFTTKLRASYNDGQSSIEALGLATGFVGTGADTLIIDDPYASPMDASSDPINAKVWKFWSEGASVRMDDDSNVIVMFHRYNEDDFVGRLIQEEGLKSQGGTWELISYRAEWDGDERLEVGGPDPIGRQVGEYLSPRKASQANYYRNQKRYPSVWQSQFQGKPSKEDGNMFKVARIKHVQRIPCNLVKVCRAWDIASTEDGDYTVGVLMGLGEDGNIYVIDVVRVRLSTDQRDRVIKRTAIGDKLRYPDIVVVVPQDPSAAGKDQARHFQKLLIGQTVKIVQSFNRGTKEVKADPWSAYVNAGLVNYVFNGDKKEVFAKNDKDEYLHWIPEWLEEHRKFPNSKRKDQVDASADSFAEIALELDVPVGEQFDTLGTTEKEPSGNEIYFAEKESEEDIYLDLIADLNMEESRYYGTKAARQKKTEGRSTATSNSYGKVSGRYSHYRTTNRT